MQFHVAIGRLQRRKSELLVKTVSIAGQQDPAPKPLECRMLRDAFQQERAQPPPAVGFQHEHVAQIGYRSQITYYPAKSNLGCSGSCRFCETWAFSAALIINPKAQRMLKRARHQVS